MPSFSSLSSPSIAAYHSGCLATLSLPWICLFSFLSAGCGYICSQSESWLTVRWAVWVRLWPWAMAKMGSRGQKKKTERGRGHGIGWVMTRPRSLYSFVHTGSPLITFWPPPPPFSLLSHQFHYPTPFKRNVLVKQKADKYWCGCVQWIDANR